MITPALDGVLRETSLQVAAEEGGLSIVNAMHNIKILFYRLKSKYHKTNV